MHKTAVKKYSDRFALYGVLGVLLLLLPGSFCSVSAQDVAGSDGISSMQDIPPDIYSDTSSAEKENTLSLDLRGVEIGELFKVLSKKLDINIIPSKNVTGRVNLFLNDVHYDDVLDIIMSSQGLAYIPKGDNVIIVVTDAEYEALYGEKFNEKKKMLTLKIKNAQPSVIFNTLSNLKSTVGNIIVDEITGTLVIIDTPEKLKIMKEVFDELDQKRVTEAFELQYANVEDIQDDITSIATEGASTVIADERTNTIIVTDLPGNMQKVRQAILVLDQETRQVLVQCEIVQITLKDEFDFGIDWESVMKEPSLWGTLFEGTFAGSELSTAYQRLTVGNLQNNGFHAVINFLNSLGDTKIISKPTLAITNKEEAVIHVGRREAIVTGTTSQSGDSTISSDSVEFIDIGTKLTVVPTINRDGFITMEIKAEISSVGSTVQTGTDDEPRSIIPIVTTSETETTAKVKDGSMIMIAGLKENSRIKDVNGVPFLDRIPILGNLFSNRASDKNQTDIIIFMTPHIVGGERLMPWDIKKLKEFPPHMRPGNRGYVEPKIKVNALRRKRR